MKFFMVDPLVFRVNMKVNACEISREAENLLFSCGLRHIIALLLNACLLGTEHEQ